jgi:DNA polymerase-1
MSSRTTQQQAGLNPKVSRIRLIQLFDGKSIYLFDVFKIGSTDWMQTLKNQHFIAHNATFEAGHFHHAGIVFSNLDCTILMGRVFLNRNVSLKDAALEAFDLEMENICKFQIGGVKTCCLSNYNMLR